MPEESGVTIDKLRIEIQADTSGAEKKITSLVNSLERLQGLSLKNLDRKFDAIGRAISGIGETDNLDKSIDRLSRMNRAISAAAKAVEALNAQDLGGFSSKMRAVMKAAEQMSAKVTETTEKTAASVTSSSKRRSSKEPLPGQMSMIPGLDAAAQTAQNVGADVTAGLSEGMTGNLASIESAAKTVADKVEGSMRDGLQTHSPSERMIPVGEDVIRGLVEGMMQAGASVEQAAQDIAERIVGKGQNFWDLPPIEADQYIAVLNLARQYGDQFEAASRGAAAPVAAATQETAHLAENLQAAQTAEQTVATAAKDTVKPIAEAAQEAAKLSENLGGGHRSRGQAQADILRDTVKRMLDEGKTVEEAARAVAEQRVGNVEGPGIELARKQGAVDMLSNRIYEGMHKGQPMTKAKEQLAQMEAELEKMKPQVEALDTSYWGVYRAAHSVGMELTRQAELERQAAEEARRAAVEEERRAGIAGQIAKLQEEIESKYGGVSLGQSALRRVDAVVAQAKAQGWDEQQQELAGLTQYLAEAQIVAARMRVAQEAAQSPENQNAAVKAADSELKAMVGIEKARQRIADYASGATKASDETRKYAQEIADKLGIQYET